MYVDQDGRLAVVHALALVEVGVAHDASGEIEKTAVKTAAWVQFAKVVGEKTLKEIVRLCAAHAHNTTVSQPTHERDERTHDTAAQLKAEYTHKKKS